MRAIIGLSLLLLLGACTSSQTSAIKPLWGFEGKFALRSPSKNQSAYISWQQFDASYTLRLWGSLGLGTQKIEGNARHITIDDGKQQQVLSATEPTPLLASINIPLGTLASNAEQLLHNCPVGTSKPLSEASLWTVYCDKNKIFSGIMRPSKIRITDGETTLILLIKQWT